MKIAISKRQRRNRLVVTREDGSTYRADLGPQLPGHDLAHFVAERALKLKDGFYGKIAQGYTAAELADKEVLKKLGAESWFAEVLARGLGSLMTGACDPESFPELVNAEMQRFEHDPVKTPTTEQARMMLAELKQLLDQWMQLEDGGTLELTI